VPEFGKVACDDPQKFPSAGDRDEKEIPFHPVSRDYHAIHRF
jgi:hypothetical protein